MTTAQVLLAAAATLASAIVAKDFIPA